MDRLSILKKAVETAQNHFENATGEEVAAASFELKAAEIRLDNYFKGIKKEAL